MAQAFLSVAPRNNEAKRRFTHPGNASTLAFIVRTTKILRLNALAFCALAVTAAGFRSDAQSGSAETAHAKSATQAAESPQPATTENTPPLTIESYSLKVRFEKDGTGTRQFDVRVKAGTEEGAKELKTLAFDYNATNEKFALKFLRVIKANGATAEAAADAVSDGLAPAAKAAPEFSELREATVKVPPIAPGDTLSYEVTISTVKPAAPGEFWFSHRFFAAHPAADEELQIDLPADSKFHLFAVPQFPPKIAIENDRKIYSWKRVNAPPTGSDSEEDKHTPPDVTLTSFTSWQQFGEWFAANEKAAAHAAEPITQKAKSLADAQQTDTAKIRALYDLVAKQIRLVRIPPEQTNFQTHEAAKVLNAGYGDDFDKCALLAAMLRAAGFSADIAVVPNAHKFDADFPWPGAIGGAVVIAGAEKQTFWMDPSPNTLPFRLLLPNMRGKEALVASGTPAPHFAETPLDPPFQSTQNVTINANVSALGKMTARVRYVLRGDNEFALRTAFASTPQEGWNGLAQTMATLDGLHGTVTQAKPSDPTATEEPFTLDFTLVTPDFLDWSKKRLLVPIPMPNFGMPNLPANANEPVNLGSPLDVTATINLKLPVNDAIHVPVGAGMSRDYAEYRSEYNAQEHEVTVKRTLRFTSHTVPAAKRGDYQSFSDAVEKDQAQGLVVDNVIPGVPAEATVSQLMEASTSEMQSGQYANALQLFNRAEELNPKQANLPLEIGTAQLQLGKYDDAIASFQKQIAANPKDENVNTLLGVAYYDERNYAEAEAAFKKQLTLKPLDSKAYAGLGAIYIDQKKFDEARAELEKAAVLEPQSAIVQLRLGEAYLGLAKTDAAVAAFEKAEAFSPTPIVSNEIAYSLAEHNVALERAKTYAQSAVDATEKSLSDADLAHLSNSTFTATNALAAFWDTLGWVDFQQGKRDEAEPWISAAWHLNQTGDSANHLAQIYLARGQKDLAIGALADSLAAGGAPAGTQEQLKKLLGAAGTNAAIDLRVKRARAQLTRERTIAIGKAGTTGKAEFLAVIAGGPNGPSAREVKFIAGDDKLAPLADRLRSAAFPSILPRGTPARIVLRGLATCSIQSAKCTFVFDRPRDVVAQR